MRTRLQGMNYDKKFDMENQSVEIVNKIHNHEIIKGRRKRGTLSRSLKAKEKPRESDQNSHP